MALQTVYCSKDIFDEVLLFKDDSDEFNILYKILINHSDIVIDMNETEFEIEICENEFYKAFLKREASAIIPLPRFFAEMDEIDLEDYPMDMFLLDQPLEKTSNTRMAKGIFILGHNELNEINHYHRPLEYLFSMDGNNTFSFWSDLFQAKNITPINSAVIIDSFLFKSFEKRKINLYSILAGMVPKDLEVPFHLNFVTDNSGGEFSLEKATKLTQEIKSFLESEKGIEVKVGLTTHIKGNNKKFHKRAILTNNFFMFSDKGFSIFEKDKDDFKVIEETDGEIRWVFDSVCTTLGDIKKKRHMLYLKEVQKLIGETKQNPRPYTFNAGFTDNRLLIKQDF